MTGLTIVLGELVEVISEKLLGAGWTRGEEDADVSHRLGGRGVHSFFWASDIRTSLKNCL